MIDLGHWFMGADLTSVVGVLRNFVPTRMIRETGTMMRANIDDGDIFIGEFAGGAICSVQSSFVTVGNYPGIEVRVYGSEGALIARLVEEFGVMETLKGAKPDAVEFVDVEVPQRLFPAGADVHEPWPRLYYSNLTANFVDEILEGGDRTKATSPTQPGSRRSSTPSKQSHHERALDRPAAPALTLELDGDVDAASGSLVEGVDRCHVGERVCVRDDLGVAVPPGRSARSPRPRADTRRHRARRSRSDRPGRILESRSSSGSLPFTNASGTRMRPVVPRSSTSWRYGCVKLLTTSAELPFAEVEDAPANSSSTPSGFSSVMTAAGAKRARRPIVHRAALTQ